MTKSITACLAFHIALLVATLAMTALTIHLAQLSDSPVAKTFLSFYGLH